MSADDIERDARVLELAARHHVRAASVETDEAFRLKRCAAACDRRWAQDMGTAYGFTFRAEELRYDARGGMTEELARRRFEPGARWSVDGQECAVVCRDESGLRVDSDRWADGMFVRAADMTRENGWLFLDLGDDRQGPPGGWP